MLRVVQDTVAANVLLSECWIYTHSLCFNIKHAVSFAQSEYSWALHLVHQYLQNEAVEKASQERMVSMFDACILW